MSGASGASPTQQPERTSPDPTCAQSSAAYAAAVSLGRGRLLTLASPPPRATHFVLAVPNLNGVQDSSPSNRVLQRSVVGRQCPPKSFRKYDILHSDCDISHQRRHLSEGDVLFLGSTPPAETLQDPYGNTAGPDGPTGAHLFDETSERAAATRWLTDDEGKVDLYEPRAGPQQKGRRNARWRALRTPNVFAPRRSRHRTLRIESGPILRGGTDRIYSVRGRDPGGAINGPRGISIPRDNRLERRFRNASNRP